MNNILENAISIIIVTFTNVYIWSKLLGKKPNYCKIKTYIIMILMSICTLVNYFYNNQFIKIFTISMLMSIFFKFMFNEKINRSIIGACLSQVIYMVSEIIFAIFMVSTFKLDAEEIVNIYFGAVLTNGAISLIAILFSNLKFWRTLYKKMIASTDKISRNQLIMAGIVLLLIANVITMTMYYKVSLVWLFCLNTVVIVFFSAALVYTLVTKNKYIKVYDKYNTTLDTLKEYEDILDKYRVSNHENKNQLLMIRNMSKNNKITKYIDNLIDNKLKDNEQLMSKTSIIPEGGLRGLIYAKLLYMKENKIMGELNVDKKIKTNELIDLDNSLMLDICKIVGVYIDNAIDEVNKLNKKYVGINIYKEDIDICISVSNNYKGNIDVDSIEQEGYTTKGNGRGYGLSLVKKILSDNKRLQNYRSITEQTFTQILKIKM